MNNKKRSFMMFFKVLLSVIVAGTVTFGALALVYAAPEVVNENDYDILRDTVKPDELVIGYDGINGGDDNNTLKGVVWDNATHTLILEDVEIKLHDGYSTGSDKPRFRFSNDYNVSYKPTIFFSGYNNVIHMYGNNGTSVCASDGDIVEAYIEGEYKDSRLSIVDGLYGDVISNIKLKYKSGILVLQARSGRALNLGSYSGPGDGQLDYSEAAADANPPTVKVGDADYNGKSIMRGAASGLNEGTEQHVDSNYIKISPNENWTRTETGVTSVTASVDKDTILPDGTANASATVNGTAGNKSVIWISSDPGIARVDPGSGAVTPVKAGTVQIYARAAEDLSKVSNKVNLMVKDKASLKIHNWSAEGTPEVKAEGISIKKGSSNSFVAYIEGTDNNDVTWKSSDESVAEIKNVSSYDWSKDRCDAVIEGKKAGKSIITADFSAHSDTIVVDSPPEFPLYVYDISLTSGSDLELAKGEKKTASVSVDGIPDGLEKGVTWKSADINVATVDEKTGEVTAVEVGETKVTATSILDNEVHVDIPVKVKHQFTVTFNPGDDYPDLEPVTIKVDSNRSYSFETASAEIKLLVPYRDDITQSSTLTWDPDERKRLIYWIDDKGQVKQIDEKVTITEDAVFTAHWGNRYTRVRMFEDRSDYDTLTTNVKDIDVPINYKWTSISGTNPYYDVTSFTPELPQIYWNPCEYPYSEFRWYVHPVEDGSAILYYPQHAEESCPLVIREQGEEGLNYLYAVWKSTEETDPTKGDKTGEEESGGGTGDNNGGNSGGGAGDNSGGNTVSTVSHNKPANTFVKGEKVDLPSKVFVGVSGIGGYKIDSGGTGKGKVNGKGVFTGKKKGTVIVIALNGKGKDAKEVDAAVITVLNKPKLKFEKKYPSGQVKVLDGYECFTTQDTKTTAADKWESKNTSVATVDENGQITITGTKGKTTITAYFGNVKVKAKIKVK